MTSKNQKLVQLIHHVSERMKQQMSASIEFPFDLTMAQLRVMQALAQNDKMSMNQIADLLKITPASATSFVNKMVEKEWLTREMDPNDRRKVYIKIAQEKQKQWQEMNAYCQSKTSDLVDVLSEEQKQQFIEILELLIAKK